MPKMTKKYKAAAHKAIAIGRDIPPGQDELYELLEAQGYAWDSETGEWVSLASQPADPPTKLVRVRVWADSSVVEQMAAYVAKSLANYELVLEERSAPYPCRPPKQLESRVYLTFSPGGS